MIRMFAPICRELETATLEEGQRVVLNDDGDETAAMNGREKSTRRPGRRLSIARLMDLRYRPNC